MVQLTEKKNGNAVIGFAVGDMPMKAFEEFESFNKREFNGCRWMAIKMLMEKSKTIDIVQGMFEEQISRIYQEVEDLKEQIEATQEKRVRPQVLGE